VTRIAVVGLGYWGPNILRNLAKLADPADLIACDNSPERLAHAGALAPGVELEPDFDVVLARPDVDGIVLATPIASHHALAGRALLAGKHVLVEKPLADSVGRAEELTALAQARRLVLMTGHTFLFSPPVMLVKQLVDDGVLGEIHYMQSSRVNLGIHQADASVIQDLAPHDFSIIFWWLSEAPVAVSACAQDSLGRGVPDVAFIDLEFGSGKVANVQLSWLAPTKVRRMTVVGSRRMVLYEDTNSEEPVKIYDKGVDLEAAGQEDFGSYRLTYRTGDIVSPRVSAMEPLQAELSHFLECIAGDAEPRGGAELPLSVVRAIEAAEASWARGGRMVELDEIRRYRRPRSLPQRRRPTHAPEPVPLAHTGESA
jgi:predicted dehydrogenase